ncbi:hypothetical protein AKJ16_DCAP17505 [Drosera capensis]
MKPEQYGHHCNSIGDCGGGDGTESKSRLRTGSNNNDADARGPLETLVGVSVGDCVAACGYFYVERRVFLALRGGGDSETESVDEDVESGADATKSYMIGKHQKVPAVIMPGDNVPKFIALPCPCEPPRSEEPDKHVICQPTRPQKPPPLAIPLLDLSPSSFVVALDALDDFLRPSPVRA